MYPWAVQLEESLWAVLCSTACSSAQLSLSTSLFKAGWRKHNPAASSLAWSDTVKLYADSFWTIPGIARPPKTQHTHGKCFFLNLPRGGRCTSGSYSPRTAATLGVSAAYNSSHQILVQVLHSLLAFRCMQMPRTSLLSCSLGMRNATKSAVWCRAQILV